MCIDYLCMKPDDVRNLIIKSILHLFCNRGNGVEAQNLTYKQKAIIKRQLIRLPELRLPGVGFRFPQTITICTHLPLLPICHKLH